MFATKTGLASEKEEVDIQKDIPKETGYLGDIDTSSSESSEAQSSDSDADDTSRTSKKGDILKLDLYSSLSFVYAFG